MPLDFAYAPKFAPVPLAGGGGADKTPPPSQATAYGRDGDAPEAPVARRHDPVAPVVAAVNASWRKKLERTMKRHAHKRMREERAQFRARLDAYLAEQAALTVLKPAPVIVAAYTRARLCDGSCDKVTRL